MKRGEIETLWLEQARAGDAPAFRRLYDHYADLVYGFLRRMLADDAAAEDALQDAFLRVHRALPGFKPDGPARLSTWILTISRRVALTRIDVDGRRREREQPMLSSDGPDASPADLGPADERADLRRALDVAVGQLPEVQRTVFVLREGCGLSYEDIAAIEELDLGTVRSRLHRARAALQESLRDYLPEHERGPSERRAIT